MPLRRRLLRIETMKTIPFKGCNTVVAKDQPEYNAMPGLEFGDSSGTKLFCWQLSWRERLTLLFTGKLWQYLLCFSQPQQPQRFTTDTPPVVALISSQRMAWIDLRSFRTDVTGCSACGQDHADMLFISTLYAMDNYHTHEGACPETCEPLFCKQHEQD